MEIEIHNIHPVPLELNINSVALVVKDYCNKNTSKPEYVLVCEKLYNELVVMFHGEIITVVTNRSNPIVDVRIRKENVLSNYIIIV